MKRFFFAFFAIFSLYACTPSDDLIELNKNELLLGNGSSELLTYTCLENSGGSITWTSSNSGIATVEDGLVVAVAPGSAVITVKYRKATDKCRVTVVAVPQGAVDMGTVMMREDGSSYLVFWAECNLGEKGFVSSPEQFGDYFAWGELEPHYSEGHSQDHPCVHWRGDYSDYGWTSYTLCNGDGHELNRYCPLGKEDYWGEEGDPDNKTELSDYNYVDDAARAILKDKWRIPTKEEWQCLISTCTWTWGTENGVEGVKVVSPNGNSIFLPGTGFRSSTGFTNFKYCFYWSSSVVHSTPSSATALFYTSSSYELRFTGRCTGYTIRPVSE